MDLCTQIRLIRVLRGLSQLELAERTGIPNTYISLLEQGKMLPSADWERRIKSALDWPLHAQVAFDLLLTSPVPEEVAA
jgi:transcriptional regulator with XRE-family HTH domain